jgi:acyl-CoA thioesterase FadM
MARIRIDIPADFSFSTNIPIRITDVNYGGHVGNDTFLSLIHEARMQFLAHHGYTEFSLEGIGIIMIDVAIEFKKELFYGDIIRASVATSEFNKLGFDLVYKLETGGAHGMKLAAIAKTGMVCYDYDAKKLAALPEKAKIKLAPSHS